MQQYNKQQGVTLIELIIAIIIISIASVALLQSLGQQTLRNVDPEIQSQANRLANQYVQEIISKSFFDPSTDPRLNPSLSNAIINASITDQTRLGAPARGSWDNLYEYHGYNSDIRDINGVPISNLTGYSVDVTVNISSGLTLGTLSNSATAGCPPIIALITVDVTDPRNQVTTLSAYRTSYWDSGC